MKRFPAWLALGYTALTIVFAYPLSVHPGDHVLSRSTDTNLYIWTLAWDAHAFVRQPLSIFEANIFFPLRHTLAYSENLIGSALFAAPVLWLSRNPVLAMNIAALVTAPLCAIGAYLLARSVGIGALGSAIAGLVYGFSPPRFFRLDQLHLTNVQWIPFALAFAHRYLHDRRRSDLRWAVAFFTLQALTSGHGAAFLSFALVALVAYRLALGERLDPATVARDVGVAGAALLVPVGLILLPYRTAQVEMGLQRNLENWHLPWSSFLASPSHVQQYLVARFLPDAHVNETAGAYLFPGCLTLVLAAVGILERPGRTNAWRRAALALNTIALLSLAVALYGTAAGNLRLRVGSMVLMSVRRPWRAWFSFAIAALFRVSIASRAPLTLKPHLPRGPFAALLGRLRNDMAAFYLLVFLFCVWLSIGPPYGLWQHVYWWPGLNFIRAPSRFSILGMLALGVLAGFGVDRLSAGLAPRGRAALATVLGALLLVEFAALPVGIIRQDPAIPAIDRWLAGRPPPFAVAEVPVSDSTNLTVREWQQSWFMLHSMAHWQKTVHGYSGLLPAFSEDLYRQLARFPDASSLQTLSDIGVNYVIVHPSYYAPADWVDVEQRLEQFPELRLEHVEADGRAYSVGRR